MKKQVIFVSTFLLNVMLLSTSCKKETIDQAPRQGNYLLESDVMSKEKKIRVLTVEELYAAVNDPNNAGSVIIMAPGNYVLDASFPNGGRLELQTDMTLRGQPGDANAVLIDQSSLPGNSFRLTPTVSTAGIRMGRGTNSLEWLSIKGGSLVANPLSAIETDLLSAVTTIGMSHVNVDCNGSRIGLMLRNRLEEHANRVINATVEHSEIKNAINPPGFGIALQNRISGSQINLSMTDNYIHGCKIGIFNLNSGLGNTVENCSAAIISHRDRIEGNGCGIDLSGGSNGSATTFSNYNVATLKMYASTIRDNNPTGHPELIPTNGALPSAVYAAGAYNSLNNISAFNRVSNNVLKMEFWGCDISNNNGTDIYGYGAWSPPAAVLGGTNNLTEIYLHGISASASFEGAASVPAEPAETNILKVFRN